MRMRLRAHIHTLSHRHTIHAPILYLLWAGFWDWSLPYLPDELRTERSKAQVFHQAAASHAPPRSCLWEVKPNFSPTSCKSATLLLCFIFFPWFAATVPFLFLFSVISPLRRSLLVWHSWRRLRRSLVVWHFWAVTSINRIGQNHIFLV